MNEKSPRLERNPDKGPLVPLRGKTHWRDADVGRGSSDATASHDLEAWLKLVKFASASSPSASPVGRRMPDLNGSMIRRWRLVKRSAVERKRDLKFSGHSLRPLSGSALI